MSARLVDAGRPDRAGAGGVGAALRLDLTALDARTIWTAAALVSVGALATVAFDAAGILIGLVGMWALQFVLAPWRVDETDHGSRLRSIVGLPRRTVVAARYVWMGLLLTTIAVVFTLAIWGVGALLDRPVSEYLATLWIGSGAILFALAAGVPARIRHGDSTTYVVMLAAGLLFVAVMIGGVALGAAPDTDGVRFTLVSLVVIGAVDLIAVPASYLTTQRWYSRKDV